MKLTAPFRLQPSDAQVEHLKQLGFFATKLYNTDNWQRRQAWQETGKIPNWYTQKKVLKDNHWYKFLPSQTAQQVIKVLQENYNSWFALRNSGDFEAKPPGFRPKAKLSSISFYQQFTYNKKAKTISLTMSRKYRKEQDGTDKLVIPFLMWKHQIKGKAKMCTVLYKNGAWLAHITFEVKPKVYTSLLDFLQTQIQAIDLGIYNLAVTYDTRGQVVLYSGRQLLSVQRYFNKEIARVQSQVTKQQNKTSSQALRNMHQKKSRQINQMLHTISKQIVQQAHANQIRIIVLGKLTGIRKNANHGKKGNQRLHAWEFAKFTNMISYKAKRLGIRVVKISERNTSKTCSSCGIVRQSNRQYRGFYVCNPNPRKRGKKQRPGCGLRLNADVNGAKNILQKYLREKKLLKAFPAFDPANDFSRSSGICGRTLTGVYKLRDIVPRVTTCKWVASGRKILQPVMLPVFLASDARHFSGG